MTMLTNARTLIAAAIMTMAGVTGALADKVDILDAAPEDAVIVNIDKMKYDNAEITIKAGDAVTWINNEVMPHNVHFLAGVAADDALKGTMLKKDESWSVRFNEPGTYDYHCTPHPFMRGKVVVE